MYQILKAFLLVFCSLLMPISSAFSAELGSEPIIRKVVSQDQKEFKVVVRDAFSQYLTLMSGNSAVAELPKVASLVTQADKYLLEFRYEPLAENDLEIVSEFEQNEQAKWRLKLQFDYKAVETALFNLGAPIWQAPRPDLMVWFAYESDDGLRTVLTSNEQLPGDYQSTLASVAQTRGVKLKFPVYDDEDRQVLSESALWGLFGEEVKQASSMYQLKNSLVVRVYPQLDQSWQYEGLLVLPNGFLPISGSVENRDLAIKSAISSAIDLMADNYSLQVNPDDQRQVRIAISDVTHYDDYHYLQNDLNSFLMVKRVVPESLKGNDVQLLLDIVGSVELLQLTLVNMPQLEEVIEIAPVAPVIQESQITGVGGKGLTTEGASAEEQPAEELTTEEASKAPEVQEEIQVLTYKYRIKQAEEDQKGFVKTKDQPELLIEE